jgi:hypothetical protein
MTCEALQTNQLANREVPLVHELRERSLERRSRD